MKNTQSLVEDCKPELLITNSETGSSNEHSNKFNLNLEMKTEVENVSEVHPNKVIEHIEVKSEVPDSNFGILDSNVDPLNIEPKKVWKIT